MYRLSTILLTLFLVAALDVTAADQQPRTWPVKREIDLSSGFGDLRPNRFHAGVDIRTGGQIGARVYSPVQGYVWRVKMSYSGYGKGLYIVGDDGYVYVYGHLDDFSTKIDKPVKKAQIKSQRYYQDLVFEKGEIPISRGEFIAFSGRTGTSAPHLHFEIRTPDNYPINPLTNGFELRDAVRPVFSRLGFKLVDNHSLFDNGSRKLLLDVAKAKTSSEYTLDTVLHFTSPFGVLVDCYDQNRVGGMRHTPYRLSLFIDDTLYYEVFMDTLDFDVQRSVNLEYDYVEAVDGEKRVRRLFHRTGNEFSGSRPVYNHRGLFGIDTTQSFGLHRAQIVAQDGVGNTSRLEFKFIWEPPDSVNLVDIDRTVENVPAGASLQYTVVDDGLIVAIDMNDDGAANARIELYQGDSLLGVEYPIDFNTQRYVCFIPPQEKYRHIDRIGFSLSDTAPTKHFEPANIYLVGSSDNESIDIDGRFMVQTGRQNFFTPRYIEVRPDKDKSNRYVIEPEAFVCRSDFEVSMSPGAAAAGKIPKRYLLVG